MNILIVRFRQMGDAILSTVVANSLHRSFPDAHIHFVLNDKIAPLFKGHPAIERLITFSPQERHSPLTYLRKVWHTVHETRYDVIIDMRSTVNTLPFALFSPATHFRIGLRKGYTRWVFNHRIPVCRTDENMIDHNLALLRPLEALGTILYDRRFTLSLTDDERLSYHRYMQQQGILFERPIMLVGVAAKLPTKMWATDKMTWVIAHLLEARPNIQLIFNYAPGHEEAVARDMFKRLGSPANVFINLQACSQRQLAALAANVHCYFGNEGGARHVVHAMGKPSLVVCSQGNSMATWIPRNEVAAIAFPPDVKKETVLSELLAFCQQPTIEC